MIMVYTNERQSILARDKHLRAHTRTRARARTQSHVCKHTSNCRARRRCICCYFSNVLRILLYILLLSTTLYHGGSTICIASVVVFDLIWRTWGSDGLVLEVYREHMCKSGNLYWLPVQRQTMLVSY